MSKAIPSTRTDDGLEAVYRKLDELLTEVPGVLWEVHGDPGHDDSRLVYASSGIRRITDAPAGSVPLSHLYSFVHPADLARTKAGLSAIFRSRGKGSIRCRCIDRRGEVLWLDNRVATILADDGTPLGVRGMTVDVTEQRSVEDALRSREVEFRNLAENAPDIIARFDTDARHTYVNPALCRAIQTDAEMLLGRTHGELGLPAGNAQRWESWVRQVLADGTERVEVFEQSDDRGRRCYHARIIPERNASGAVVSVLTMVRDISDRRRVEEAQRFLASASARLSTTLDFQETLDTVTDLAVPFLADVCAVDLVGDDGAFRRVALRSHDLEAESRARETAGEPPYDADAEVGVPVSIRTGESQLVPYVTDEWLESIGASEQLVFALKSLGVQSILTSALFARGRVIGSITFSTTTSGRHYTSDDMALAEQLASRCALAIDNARLFRQVEGLNRSKDEFIAMLGHELRNPLAAIGNALMAVERYPDVAASPFRGARREIERQLGLMVRLVDDLLDATRITHGLIHLCVEPMDAAAAVRDAAGSLQAEAAEKGQTVELDTPAALPLTADPVRVHQIVTNLLQNAIKYTPRGGRIHVTARRNGRTASIRVSDNGNGIEPDLLPRVFDLLVQGTPNLSRTEGGLGIGLTLVKRLVEMHGGSVEAFSEGPGQGSVFEVSFPLHDSAVDVPEAQRSADSSRRVDRALSIVLADDNEFAAQMLAEVLRSAGHDVRVALDGATALEMAVKSPPDLALLDIGLPSLDGYEVARGIRSVPACTLTRLIAVTGYGGEEDRRKSFEAGFDAHLVKPLDFNLLESLLMDIRGRQS